VEVHRSSDRLHHHLSRRWRNASCGLRPCAGMGPRIQRQRFALSAGSPSMTSWFGSFVWRRYDDTSLNYIEKWGQNIHSVRSSDSQHTPTLHVARVAITTWYPRMHFFMGEYRIHATRTIYRRHSHSSKVLFFQSRRTSSMPSCTGNGCFVEVHVHSTVGSQIYGCFVRKSHVGCDQRELQ
jgi:hypothetical protein